MCISKVGYKVSLPDNVLIHDVFYVTMLKPVLKTKETTSNTMLALIQPNDMLKSLPEKIVDSRMTTNTTKLLVKRQFVRKCSLPGWMSKALLSIFQNFLGDMEMVTGRVTLQSEFGDMEMVKGRRAMLHSEFEAHKKKSI